MVELFDCLVEIGSIVTIVNYWFAGFYGICHLPLLGLCDFLV